MNKQYKFIILGAGPSGLSFAHTLLDCGERSFLIIEKEEIAGGLCRSVIVDEAPLDIGGGHFLDVKNQAALDLLFRFMPRSEWREFARVSKIRMRGTEIDYPLEANLWQFPIEDQLDFLQSVSEAGCVRGLAMPESFEDWISWKLGRRIADEYMLPYNRKIWSTDLKELGTYWLYKLPDVSFREILQSCLERRPSGAIPAHGIFLYPKRCGYGEVWRRMGLALGEHLLTSTPVNQIDIRNKIINQSFRAEMIINTIPWTQWLRIAHLPESIENCISQLRYVSIDVDYFSQDFPSAAHWIYEPDERLAYHRILLRSNFCLGSRGYWTETNSKRPVEKKAGWSYGNEYAYPLNTIDKPHTILEIRKWAEQNGIVSLGRWGTWEHMNSDIAVSSGIAAAKKILGNNF